MELSTTSPALAAESQLRTNADAQHIPSAVSAQVFTPLVDNTSLPFQLERLGPRLMGDFIKVPVDTDSLDSNLNRTELLVSAFI